jgi:hypothetical protein
VTDFLTAWSESSLTWTAVSAVINVTHVVLVLSAAAIWPAIWPGTSENQIIINITFTCSGYVQIVIHKHFSNIQDIFIQFQFKLWILSIVFGKLNQARRLEMNSSVLEVLK